MSIFDSIANTVGSLFEGDVSSAWDSLKDIDGEDLLKGAVKGFSSLREKQDKIASKERDLVSFIERNSRLQDTDQEGKFKPHQNTQFGAGNYSADYQQIQREWASFLTGVADNKSVPGKRYSELN